VIENLRPVPIGKMIVSTEPEDVLVVYGLGSCVVICLYDPLAQVGGMLHALLPSPTWDKNNNNNNKNAVGNPTKFVNQGVPWLINSLVALGAKPTRLVAQLCGGAQMLTAPMFNGSLNIGQRNVLAAETALQIAKLEILSQATGGHIGRTVKLYIASGQVTVKTLVQKEQILKDISKVKVAAFSKTPRQQFPV
jgi:chemotaxis protein CheD